MLRWVSRQVSVTGWRWCHQCRRRALIDHQWRGAVPAAGRKTAPAVAAAARAFNGTAGATVNAPAWPRPSPAPARSARARRRPPGRGGGSLDVVRRDIAALRHQRARLGHAQHRDAGARRQAVREPAARTCFGNQRLKVVEHRLRRMHLQHLLLGRFQLARQHHRRQPRHHTSAVFAGQQSALGGAVGVAERDAHQEAVELAFGQRVGAELV
jgi:hypothetical protein